MILVVIKIFAGEEVKEFEKKEEADEWLKQRAKELRRSYPHGNFPTAFYKAEKL